MRFDLNSPVQFADILLVHNANGQITFQTSFTNYGGSKVSALVLEIKLFDSFGEIIQINSSPSFRLEITDLDIANGQTASINPVPLPDNRARRIEFDVKKIGYESKENLNISENKYVEVDLKSYTQAALDSIKYKLDFSPKYVFEESKDFWVCICGIINAPGEPKCKSCGTKLDYLRTSLSKEKILEYTDEFNEYSKTKRLEEEKIAAAAYVKKQEQMQINKLRYLFIAKISLAAVMLAAAIIYGVILCISLISNQNIINELNSQTQSAAQYLGVYYE